MEGRREVMSELIRPTKKKCSSCYYGFKVGQRSWGCAYTLRCPEDAEHKMRILNPDGTRQYAEGYCDKYVEGRVPDYLWFEEGFFYKQRKRNKTGINNIVRKEE